MPRRISVEPDPVESAAVESELQECEARRKELVSELIALDKRLRGLRGKRFSLHHPFVKIEDALESILREAPRRVFTIDELVGALSSQGLLYSRSTVYGGLHYLAASKRIKRLMKGRYSLRVD